MKTCKGRFLCWDDTFVSERQGVEIRMHKPEKKNLALVCDDVWEGVHNGYGSLVKVGDGYRLYYRAYAARLLPGGKLSEGRAVICVAESRDGITFHKPSLSLCEWDGIKDNNIIYDRDRDVDNFSVFYDENPDCPEEERFKALSEMRDGAGRHLCCFVSADGYRFTRVSDIPVKGAFDSFNTLFWDKTAKEYRVYFRSYHRRGGAEIDNIDTTDVVHDVRDVRLATSPDFKNWTEHGYITFAKGQGECSLYTNQIVKYFRDEKTYIGFPVRYSDRATQRENYRHMPMYGWREEIIASFGRGGTVQKDCVIMTSHDGLVFDRRDEAFLTPGPENRYNWWYGDCYTVYGMAETPAEEQGAANEISFYVGEGYRVKSVSFRRYTVRLDGFFSFYGPFTGGVVTTLPMTVDGDELRVNFATSGAGGLAVTLLNEDGTPIFGYESYEMFGDATDRLVDFAFPLSALRGKTVRFRFALRDAHLYSFSFA